MLEDHCGWFMKVFLNHCGWFMKVFFKPRADESQGEHEGGLDTNRDESDMKVWRKQASLRPGSCS